MRQSIFPENFDERSQEDVSYPEQGLLSRRLDPDHRRPDHPLRQEDLEHRRRTEGPALRREPGPARGPLRGGRELLRHGRRGLPAGPAQARLGPDRGEPDPVGQAPGQDQPDGRGQRHQHAAVPHGQARGHHPQAQQPLRRGLGGRGTAHGPEPSLRLGPHRGLRRDHRRQPHPGQGLRRVHQFELLRGHRGPGLRRRRPGGADLQEEPAHHPHPGPGRTGEDRGHALPGHQVPGRRRPHRAGLLPQPHPGRGRLPAGRNGQGRHHLHRPQAHAGRGRRPALRLGRGGGRDLQLHHLRPRRGHGVHRHGRTGPRGLRGADHPEGLHQVR